MLLGFNACRSGTLGVQRAIDLDLGIDILRYEYQQPHGETIHITSHYTSPIAYSENIQAQVLLIILLAGLLSCTFWLQTSWAKQCTKGIKSTCFLSLPACSHFAPHAGHRAPHSPGDTCKAQGADFKTQGTLDHSGLRAIFSTPATST